MRRSHLIGEFRRAAYVHATPSLKRGGGYHDPNTVDMHVVHMRSQGLSTSTSWESPNPRPSALRRLEETPPRRGFMRQPFHFLMTT
jgi:hypothetical protein